MLICNTFIFKCTQIVASASILVPILIGIVKYKKLFGPLRLVLLFLGVSLLFEIVVYSLAFNGINNMPFFHLFSLVQLCFISTFYYLAFKDAFLRKGILVTAVLLLLFMAYNSLYLQGIYKFDSNSKGLLGLFSIILSLLYFRKIMHEEILVRLEEHPMFWVNSGIMIYFAGSIFLFSFFNEKFVAIYDYYYSLYMINAVFYLLYVFFVSRGLLCLRKI